MNIEKLYPAFKDYLWGGNRLKEKYGKITDSTPCAESWELSYHKDGKCTLSSGVSLESAAGTKDLGRNVSDFESFPVLIKFIDARDDLSVQVHPSDDYALKNENSYGKTEMWYIVDADEGAGIYLGFKRDVTKEEYRSAIENNTLTELLNFYRVKAGECYFIPSGTIHAIGKGTLICEIQQNSNLTYRVYDWGRVDKNGKSRELHVDKALDVTTLTRFAPLAPCNNYLGLSKYFTVKKLGEGSYCADENSFNCISCVMGNGNVEGIAMNAGDTFFVPAGYGEYRINGDVEVIMTQIS